MRMGPEMETGWEWMGIAIGIGGRTGVKCSPRRLTEFTYETF